MKPAKDKRGLVMPLGFRASGVHAGIKHGHKKDMGLIVSDTSASIAGMFTTNRVQAAPVLLCKKRITGQTGRAIIVNSGNANACTGKQGQSDAEEMASFAAQCLNIDPRTVFVCSTGVIGVPMPMPTIKKGIRLAAKKLSTSGGSDIASAIMTTDTHAKQAYRCLQIEGQSITIAGIAKGAGMISPHMATMLAFFITDAHIKATYLQSCFSSAVKTSFNRIIVDGDQSTNDTALILANGASGCGPIKPRTAAWKSFCAALNEVAFELAMMIVRDGEGATKFVTIKVIGATGKKFAEKIARSVGCSPLVKTSWYGADPNWGRIICAIGNAGVQLQTDRIDIAFGNRQVFSGGRAVKIKKSVLRDIMSAPEFSIEINLNAGNASSDIYTCDYSEEYIKINSAYTT